MRDSEPRDRMDERRPPPSNLRWKSALSPVGKRARSLGGQPLTRAERRELAEIEAELKAAGIYATRPRTLAECPPATECCPWASCRHHLAVEVVKRPGTATVKVTFPGREIDEIPATCSLRVAAAAAIRRDSPSQSHKLRSAGWRSPEMTPAMSIKEVARLTNCSVGRIRQVEQAALAKFRMSLPIYFGEPINNTSTPHAA
jgi:hypothetical protein